MMSTSKYTGLFVSATLIATLVACSDSTDSDGSDTASDSETTTESTDIPTGGTIPTQESTEPPVEPHRLWRILPSNPTILLTPRQAMRQPRTLAR